MPVPVDSRPPIVAAPSADEPRVTKRSSAQAPGKTEYVIRMPVGDPIVVVVPPEDVRAFEASAGAIVAVLDEHLDYGTARPRLQLHQTA